MKKLMTTVSAVALAFGLYATDTGTSFEGLDAGEMDPYKITATTGELTAQGEGTSYWATNGIDGLELKVVNDPRIIANADRPDKYADAGLANYLKIKTPIGSPVTRNVSVGGAGTTIPEKGFYFDSLVKFTAFDEDQAIDLNGGKIAIWLKEVYGNGDNADPTGTNLVITAGFLGANAADVVATNYECAVDGVDFSDGAWHRVTVKAIDNIYSTTPKVPGFVVFVDKQYAYTTAESGTPMAEKGINSNNLSPNAKQFHVACRGALFPSADQTSGDKLTIAAVQFAGQGDVDDLVFTPDAPNGMADYEFFTIKVGANVDSVDWTDGNNSGTVTSEMGETNIVYTSGLGVKVTANCATGYMEGGVTRSDENHVAINVQESGTWYEPDRDGEWIRVEATVAGATVVPAVAGKSSFESVKLAFDAINANGNGKYDLTLNNTFVAENAAGSIELDNANATVTLDLAGNSITGAVNQSAIILTKGTLIITNSTPAVGHVVVDGAASIPVVSIDEGDLTIAGGYYDGMVDYHCTIAGGAIRKAENTAGLADLQDAVITGYTLVDGTGADAAYYVLDVATCKVLFVDGDVTTTNTVNYGASSVGVVPEFLGRTGYTAAWDNDPTAVVSVTSDLTFTAVYTATYYTITYMYDGAALTGLTPATYTVEDAVTLPTEVDLGVVGVSFQAWTNAQGEVVTDWAAGAENGNQTFYAQVTSLGPSGLDPAAGTTNVTVTAASEADAITEAKSAITVPTGSGAKAAEYAELFTYSATAGSASGTYNVAITGIKDTVVTGVDTSAVALLTSGSDTVAVPAGLYYRITPSEALPISGTAVQGLSTGSVSVTKPGTTQGFLKVELSPTQFEQN